MFIDANYEARRIIGRKRGAAASALRDARSPAERERSDQQRRARLHALLQREFGPIIGAAEVRRVMEGLRNG